MKTKFKSLFAILLVICTLATNLSIANVAFASTPKGVVTSAQNYSSSIKVTWTRDSSKTGYYIYRRVSTSSTFKRVKKITKNSITSWQDTNVKNGTKYVYRVRAYKGSKISTNKTDVSLYRISRPTIQSISSTDVGNIKIKSSTNTKATGYQVKYSLKSNFSNSKTVKVGSTKTINKAIGGFTPNKTYYVKIRAYYVGKKTYYSAYSRVKTCKTKAEYYAYTSHLYTTLYTKPQTNSSKKSIDYMSKIKVGAVYVYYSKGDWRKVTYNGKKYYIWETPNSKKFTKTKNNYDYTDKNNTKYQQEVVDYAVNIFKTLPTEYAHGQSDGVKNSNGKYGFDCSGFTAYVINKVMQKYVPTYRISASIKKIYSTGVIYNYGYDSQFSAKTVCKGSYDFSKMQPGDIIIWNLENASKNDFAWNHCGIYLGKKQFIHSTPSAGGVTINPIEGAYERDLVKVIRVLPRSVTLINKVKTSSCSIGVYSEFPIYKDSSPDVTTIPKGAKVKLVSVNSTGDRAYVDYNGKKGYVCNPSSNLK